MNFQIRGLSPEPFAPLFALSDAELAEQGAIRRIADEPKSFPCRVSLEDANPGEEVLLLPHRHHTGPSPYQSSGPIYVRRGAKQAILGVNQIPAMQIRRLCSVRAYDGAGLLVVAEVVAGAELESQIRRFLERSEVDSIHVHNARPGCFAFRVERV